MRIVLDRHSDASLWKDAPTCDNGRLTSQVSLAAICAPAAAVRNSAALCGWDMLQPASQIDHRAHPVLTAIAFAAVMAVSSPESPTWFGRFMSGQPAVGGC